VARAFLGVLDLLAVVWVPMALTTAWRALNPHYGQGELWFWLAVLSLPATLIASIVAVFGLATQRPSGVVLSRGLCGAGGIASVALGIVLMPDLGGLAVAVLAALTFGAGFEVTRPKART